MSESENAHVKVAAKDRVGEYVNKPSAVQPEERKAEVGQSTCCVELGPTAPTLLLPRPAAFMEVPCSSPRSFTSTSTCLGSC